jgi:TolB protein
VSGAEAVSEVLAPALVSPIAERGRIFFSAPDESGIVSIFSIDVVADAAASLVIGEGRAPSLQPQGEIVAFSSLRSDMYGLGGFNLRTGERLRFTFNLEDTLPRWNAAGDRLIFSSTREGDRKPRVYRTWADGSANSETLRSGQDADLHPQLGRIVYKGCDDQGAACGLWTMAEDGSDPSPLTGIADDSRPRWSPAGDAVVFMSETRDGNWEVYLLLLATGEIRRLTDNPALDGLPAFSPDGTHIAFVSNRGGVWEILTLAVDASGEATSEATGEATPTASTLFLIGPDLPDWLEQGLDWTR